MCLTNHANVETLRSILQSLKEDIDDTTSWAALVDWGPDAGEVDWAGQADTIHGKAWLIITACSKAALTREGSQRCQWTQLHSEYAEPGYTTTNGCIATGNYNSITRFDNVTITTKKVDGYPELMGDLLERLGVDCEWSDEWAACGECNRLVRTQPDSMGWQPHYHVDEGELLCLYCYNAETERSEDEED